MKPVLIFIKKEKIKVILVVAVKYIIKRSNYALHIINIILNVKRRRQKKNPH
tara:strand:- start:318 stop:473 length:156 start_codon:yes stop_codon:yes gene_type:complete